MRKDGLFSKIRILHQSFRVSYWHGVVSLAREYQHIIRHCRKALCCVLYDQFVHQAFDHRAHSDFQRLFAYTNSATVLEPMRRVNPDYLVGEVPKVTGVIEHIRTVNGRYSAGLCHPCNFRHKELVLLQELFAAFAVAKIALAA